MDRASDELVAEVIGITVPELHAIIESPISARNVATRLLGVLAEQVARADKSESLHRATKGRMHVLFEANSAKNQELCDVRMIIDGNDDGTQSPVRDAVRQLKARAEAAEADLAALRRLLESANRDYETVFSLNNELRQRCDAAEARLAVPAGKRVCQLIEQARDWLSEDIPSDATAEAVAKASDALVVDLADTIERIAQENAELKELGRTVRYELAGLLPNPTEPDWTPMLEAGTSNNANVRCLDLAYQAATQMAQQEAPRGE